MSEQISGIDDLNGMLPSEIVSAFRMQTERAEAAEQQAARLTAALQAVMRRIDRSGNACWCPPIFDDRVFHTSDCLRARAALAASQPAPAAETERVCLDCRTPLRTRSVARCYECVERNMLANEANYPRGGQAEGEG